MCMCVYAVILRGFQLFFSTEIQNSKVGSKQCIHTRVIHTGGTMYIYQVTHTGERTKSASRFLVVH